MRAGLLASTGLAWLLIAAVILAWSAGVGRSAQASKGKGPPLDLDKEILKQIKEAYKAPHEVPQDVLDDLRRSYKPGSSSRETSILKALQRLYLLTAQEEAAMLQDVRKAIEKPSAENEKRLFEEISKLLRMPEGTVPAPVQRTQAQKTFDKLDADGNGKLSSAEMPENLRTGLGRWDTNADGAISSEEYWAYYQGRLRSLSDDVASGKIELGLKRGGPVIPLEEEKRPIMYRAGKLPANLPPWFAKLDRDNDGQVSLFEWRKAGKNLKDFAAVDRNADGLVTAEETLRYLAQQEAAPARSSSESSAGTFTEKKAKKKK